MSEYDEPWSIDDDVIEDSGKQPLGGSYCLDDDQRIRIVACVNFCAGVSNEKLAKYGTLQSLIELMPKIGTVAARPPSDIEERIMKQSVNAKAMQQVKTVHPILPPALLEALQAYVESRIELAMAGNEVGADGYGVSTVDERQKAEATWQAVLAANKGMP